jgi:hypothetical protein
MMKPALATTADAPVLGLKRYGLIFVVPALSRLWAVMSTLTAVVGSAKQSGCGTKSRCQTATVRTVADIADGQRGSDGAPLRQMLNQDSKNRPEISQRESPTTTHPVINAVPSRTVLYPQGEDRRQWPCSRVRQHRLFISGNQ